jgi:hypothetical protein
MNSYIESTPGGTSFVGPKAVELYRAIVIASALRLYAQHRIKANRAYTPSAMLLAATAITGKVFRRGQYLEAAAALDAWRFAQRICDPVPVIRS